MNTTESKLYTQLCEFQLDDPKTLYPMSTRLAWEHHWSEIYTFRATCDIRGLFS